MTKSAAKVQNIFHIRKHVCIFFVFFLTYCHFVSQMYIGTLFVIDKIANSKTQNTMSKIQPLADRVLIKPAAAEEKTVGGIIIPDSAKEKPLRG